jgi:hypothetical protein
MKSLKAKLGLVGIAAALLISVGCLVSGTFVAVFLIVDADFTTQTGFYYYPVDLTDIDVWDEHKDEIKNIETIGFELWITNHEGVQRIFSVYVDEQETTPWDVVGDLDANAYLALDGLTLAPSTQTHITYGQSFGLLKNVDKVKELVEGGVFDYYGVSNGGLPSGYTIDSVRIVITFMAGA